MAISFSKFSGIARAFIAYWKQEIGDSLFALFTFGVEITTLHGKMRGSEEDLTLLYVGRGLNLAHFKRKFFVEAETLHTQKSNVLSFRKAMKAQEDSADVVLLDVGFPYTKSINKNGDYLELPDWICMTLPLEETWDATVQNFRKTMRKNIGRLIRKNNYRCVATNEPAIVDSFYDDFYVTFIKSRHADETHLTPRAIVEQCAREGTILQVVGDDGPVAAGVYFPEGGILRLLVTGMPEAYLENPPVAAMQALYYFSIQYAFDNGYKTINFMGTRAFPTNGLFQFKRKWGAGAEDDFSINSSLLRPANNNATAAKFCELFPVIARKNGALQLVVCAGDDAFGEAECQKALADYHCGGVEDVKVVHLSDQPAPCQMMASDAAKIRMKSSNLENFAENYVRD